MQKWIRFNSIIFSAAILLAPAWVPAQTWGSAPPLNTPRAGACAVALNGYIYVLGGKTAGGTILNTVERFDPTTGIWDNSNVAAFDRPRFNAAAVALDGYIYLIGGRDDENEVLKKVEVYDPAANSWDEIRQMENRREEHVALLLRGTMCVIGGKDESGNSIDVIEWYNKNNDEWYAAPSNLNQPKQSPFAVAVDDTVYLFGGFTPFPTISNFKGSTSPGWYFTWTTLPPLQAGRGYGATGRLGNQVFLAGGRTITDTTAMVEIFDLQTRQIEPGPPVNVSRAGAAGVVLNEKFYVIGGYTSGQSQPLSSVEVYPIIVGIADPPAGALPKDFAQITGYPNPFNGAIHLDVSLPRQNPCELTIYDLQGCAIKTLHHGTLQAGTHTFRWEGRDEAGKAAAAGIYFAVLKSEREFKTFKMVYVR